LSNEQTQWPCEPPQNVVCIPVRELLPHRGPQGVKLSVGLFQRISACQLGTRSQLTTRALVSGPDEISNPVKVPPGLGQVERVHQGLRLRALPLRRLRNVRIQRSLRFLRVRNYRRCSTKLLRRGSLVIVKRLNL